MTKVWIDQDEDWPVYRLTPDDEVEVGTFEVELPDELIAALRTVSEQWRQVQSEVAMALLRQE